MDAAVAQRTQVGRVKLRKLFQPKKQAFWLMLAFNLLSTVLVWVVNTYPLSLPASLVIAVFAIGNMFFGTRLAWALMNERV